MANDLNQCNFIGRLAADPEQRFMPSGEAISSFRLAVGWKSKDKEGVEWVSLSAFGKVAEIINTYCRKGSQVYVSARLKNEEYEKNGEKRYATKFIVDRLQLLAKAAGDGDTSPRASAPAAAPSRPSAMGNAMDDMSDDIPFATSSAHFDIEPRLARRMRRYG